MLIGDGQKITSEGSTLGIGGSLTTDTSITSGTYISSGTSITATTSITAGISFKIGSVDLNQTDLEKIDSITNGTASANKALVVDNNKDINGIRNLNIDGNLTIAGITTTINSTTVEVSDGLFKYAKDNVGDTVDFGWYGKYVDTNGISRYSGMFQVCNW